MSRVFVSCARRDRAVGEQLGSLVRSLGHDTSDDQDDAEGTAWWNEVVGRIEASDVFVAVASPAYAEAHTCRLAAKHAAATGLPVVRVDLDRKVQADCHPVVAEAIGVPFAPEDPEVVARLAHALDGTTPEVAEPAAAGPPEPEPPQQPQQPQPQQPEYSPRFLEPAGSAEPSRAPELGVALVMALSVLGLVYVALSIAGGSEPQQGRPAAASSRSTPEPGAPATPAAPPAAPGEAAVALLSGLKVVGSPLLPAGSCQAGVDAVTCTDPVPNISSVTLTSYPAAAELYAAYTAQVASVSGEPFEENTSNCSASEAEGEVGWNLDRKHTVDFSVAEQVQGGLDPASASAGRVFCTDTQKVMTLVWTQDPGLLVTVVGQPSDEVVAWWGEVHLQIACASGLVGTGCDELDRETS